MARSKEFDPDRALECAIGVFADHGFEGSSTEQLLDMMGISRQSLYDTFGSKRDLYLAALDRYKAHSITQTIGLLNSGASPLRGIEAVLMHFAGVSQPDPNSACMGVSAICEFGRSDGDVTAVTDTMGRSLTQAFVRRLTDAQALGEVSSDLAIEEMAQFLVVVVSGMKLGARAGIAPSHLQDTARLALRALA